jgi:hypothetical protein
MTGFFRKQFSQMLEKDFQKYDSQNRQIAIIESSDKEYTEVAIEIALKHGYKLIQQSGTMSVWALRPKTVLTFQKEGLKP